MAKNKNNDAPKAKKGPDLTGQKVGNIGRQELIRDRLREAVEAEAGDEPAKRRKLRLGAA